VNREHLIELVFLALLFGGLLYIGPGAVFHRQLSHEKPVYFAAGDGYLYAKLTNYAYDAGSFKYLPPYSAAGFNDSIEYHPPLMPVLAAAFAHTAGLHGHDAMALMMALGMLFGALLMYWLVRSWNKTVAMLGAALFVFLYISRFAIGYTWGQVLFHLGTFFLMALFYLMGKQDLKHWWVPAGILIAGTINAHTSETFFFYVFAVFFLSVKFVVRQLPKHELVWWLKQLALASLLAVILSFNYIIIFHNGYGADPENQLRFDKPMKPEDFGAVRAPLLTDFTMPVLIALLVGVAIAAVLACKQAHAALLASGFMFLVGMSNYIGIESLFYRAFQTRFAWPAYLAVFFGITLYFIIKKFTRNTLIIAIVGIALAGFFVQQNYQTLNAEIIYDQQWEGIEWLYANTDPMATVLFLYGDSYDQWVRMVKRPAFLASASDLVAMAQSGTLRRMVQIEPFVVNDVYLLYRKSFFEFGRHAKEQNITIFPAKFDLCSYDYYVIDRRSAYQPQLAQLNVQFANLFLAHNMTMQFQNDHLVILKHRAGGECIA